MDGSPRLTLTHLLAVQKGPIRRDADFATLTAMLSGSAALRGLTLNRTAWRLLNGPRLKIQYLDNFYATYRVPKSPFFALFLELKWRNAERLITVRSERKAAIERLVASWPEEGRSLLDYVAAVERVRNVRLPVWQSLCFPPSLKRAREIAAFDEGQWRSYAQFCLTALRARYRRITLPAETLLVDYARLGCFPDPATGKPPLKAELKAAFRERSKCCHPDSGGESSRFVSLKEAADRLLRFGEG